MKEEKKKKSFMKSRWIYVLHPTNRKRLVRWRYEIEFIDKDIVVSPELRVELKN